MLVAAVLLLAAALFVGAGAADENAGNVAKIGTTEYATLEEAFAAVADGQTIELLMDCSVSADIEIKNTSATTKTITLDLCGKRLDLNQKHIVIKDTTVILNDTNGSATTTTFEPNATTGLWEIKADGSGSKSVTGGVIYNGWGHDEDAELKPLTGGGAIAVHATPYVPETGGMSVCGTAKLVMNAGNIVGCRAGVGGAVLVITHNDAATGLGVATLFEMNGGCIAGCIADGQNQSGPMGGAVFVRGHDSVFTMKEPAKLIENTAKGASANGGAVYLHGGGDQITAGKVPPTFNMQGGLIDSCKVETTDGKYGNGGAVWVNGTFNLSGGVISNCSANGNRDSDGASGGAVYVRQGILNITGGTIESSNSGAAGANVFIRNGATSATISGNAVIKTTFAVQDGGSVIVTVNGGSFTDIANAVKYAANGATIKLAADAEIPAADAITIPAGVTLDTNNYKLEINGELIVEGKFVGIIGTIAADTLIIKEKGKADVVFENLEAVGEGIELEANAVLTIGADDTTTTIDDVLENVKSAKKGSFIVDASISEENNAVMITADYDGSGEIKKADIHVTPGEDPVSPTSGTTTLVLNAGVAYEVTIPMAVSLDSSTPVEDTYGITMTTTGSASEKVVMKLASSANNFNVKHSTDATKLVPYSVTKDSTAVPAGGEVVSCPANEESATQDLMFTLTGTIPLAGTYSDSLTFTIGVEEA